MQTETDGVGGGAGDRPSATLAVASNGELQRVSVALTKSRSCQFSQHPYTGLPLGCLLFVQMLLLLAVAVTVVSARPRPEGLDVEPGSLQVNNW